MRAFIIVVVVVPIVIMMLIAMVLPGFAADSSNGVCSGKTQTVKCLAS